MPELQIDKYYQREAKTLVDVMHDKKFLNPELTRDSSQWLEDFIALIMQQQTNAAAKCAVLTAKMKG